MTHDTTTSGTDTSAQVPARDRDDLAAQYDAFHTARSQTPLVTDLYATAMGEDSPHEIATSSSCDWPLLGLAISRLRMPPGRLLVDAGCGTGGIGLWLARALNVRLIGLDISPVAVAQATARRTQFIPADRAAFHTASLDATGLADGCAAGVVCVDALGLAADRGAAVRELGRLLGTDGRLVMTRTLRRGTEPRWSAEADAAGLQLEHVDERPGEPAMWGRLYRLWLDHAADLRRELGAVPAERMLSEAQRMLPALPDRRAVLVTLRRPTAPDAATPKGSRAATTLTSLGRVGGNSPAPGERTAS